MDFEGKNVIIMCCSSCNADCKHCYIEYKEDIEPQRLLSMVTKLKEKYNISLNGSELLLNREYIKILNMINQERVLTNGLIIYKNDELLSFIKENNIKWVCMSYHFDLHPLVSPIDKDIILDNIKKLRQEGFLVEIMTTISRCNYKNIDQMVKEAINLNANCIRFTNLFNEGNANNMTEEILDDNQINEFFDLFYAAKNKYKNHILVRRSGTFNRDFRKSNSTYYCPSIIDTVAIAPNNKVYPCPFLVKEGYEIGTYQDGIINLDEIYEHKCDTCFLHDTLNKGIIYKKVRKK